MRVMLIDHAGGEFNGVTSNVSKTGFSMNLGQPLPVSISVTGRLFPPEGHPIAFAAEVRWVRAEDEPRNANETHSIGLLFLGPPKGRRAASHRAALRPVTANIESLRAGPEARSTKIIEPEDLGLPPDVGAASLSPARAALWIDRAASLALAGVLPKGIVSLPISMEIQIAPRATVEVGARVVTHVQLVEVGSGSSWLRFKATIKHDARQLASGIQLHEVLEAKKR
jgi:hypothetical protein